MLSIHHGGKRANVHWLAEVAGWIGAAAILVAYILVLNGVIEGDSAWNAALNLVGAAGILTIGIAKGVLQSVVLNLIWAVVAAIALVRIWIS